MATPAEAVHLLEGSGETVATCESITGGLICGALTSVPGSSEVVRGGLITYATDLKTLLAGVGADLISTHGVVSAEVARAMAEGVRQVCRADWGVAVTGVAGPGPSEGVPAGTVWLSVVGPDAWVTRETHEDGDRAQVRAAVVDEAVAALCDLLRVHESGPQSGPAAVN